MQFHGRDANRLKVGVLAMATLMGVWLLNRLHPALSDLHASVNIKLRGLNAQRVSL
jgi:hypothetical protein